VAVSLPIDTRRPTILTSSQLVVAAIVTESLSPSTASDATHSKNQSEGAQLSG